MKVHRIPAVGPPLSLAPPPHPGETFQSWVMRLAWANGRSWSWALGRLGYPRDRNSRPRIPAMGVVLPTDDAQRISLLTDIPVDRLQATTLMDFLGYAAPQTDAASHGATAVFASQNWIFVRGSQFCPECLRETGGVWDLSWKFPWTYACVRHGRLLAPTCPSCGDLPNAGHDLGRTAIAFPTWVLDPTRCANPQRRELRRSGRAGEPCDLDLTAIPVQPPIGAEAIATQRLLLSRLQGQARGSWDVWWRDLRVTTSTLLAIGDYNTPDLITGRRSRGAPQRAWSAWVRAREELEHDARERFVDTGVTERTPRLETWHHKPRDPALMAAVLPAAIAMLDADTDGLARGYDATKRRKDGTHWLPLRLNEASASPELRGRLHRIIVATRSRKETS